MTVPDLVSYGITGFLVWLFALAAIHKLRAPSAYCELLPRYLPGLPASRALVVLIAALEGLIALALLVPVLQRAALVAAALVLLGYAVLMALQLLRGQSLQRCGCAGPASDVTVSGELLLRNLVAAALALFAAAPPVAVSTGAGGFMLPASLAGFLIFLYLCCEQLLGNAQRMNRGQG